MKRFRLKKKKLYNFLYKIDFYRKNFSKSKKNINFLQYKKKSIILKKLKFNKIYIKNSKKFLKLKPFKEEIFNNLIKNFYNKNNKKNYIFFNKIVSIFNKNYKNFYYIRNNKNNKINKYIIIFLYKFIKKLKINYTKNNKNKNVNIILNKININFIIFINKNFFFKGLKKNLRLKNFLKFLKFINNLKNMFFIIKTFFFKYKFSYILLRKHFFPIFNFIEKKLNILKFINNDNHFYIIQFLFKIIKNKKLLKYIFYFN